MRSGADPGLGRLSARVWRLELPSATLPPHTTTNSYLIVDAGVALLVDPGFSDPTAGLSALERALERAGARGLKGVALSHTHRDHLEGLPAVLDSWPDLPVWLHPDEYPRLDRPGARALTDERVLTVGGTLVRALHTPGHSPGHLAFWIEDDRALLAGDLVAGHGSTWVGLPEGDVASYLASLDRLLALEIAALGPGHGAPPPDPAARLRQVREHRLERERQVLAALAEPRTLGELRTVVYPDAPEAARRLLDGSLLAHLRKLMREMRVLHLGDDPEGPYRARS